MYIKFRNDFDINVFFQILNSNLFKFFKSPIVQVKKLHFLTEIIKPKLNGYVLKVNVFLLAMSSF